MPDTSTTSQRPFVCIIPYTLAASECSYPKNENFFHIYIQFVQRMAGLFVCMYATHLFWFLMHEPNRFEARGELTNVQIGLFRSPQCLRPNDLLTRLRKVCSFVVIRSLVKLPIRCEWLRHYCCRSQNRRPLHLGSAITELLDRDEFIFGLIWNENVRKRFVRVDHAVWVNPSTITSCNWIFIRTVFVQRNRPNGKCNYSQFQSNEMNDS